MFVNWQVKAGGGAQTLWQIFFGNHTTKSCTWTQFFASLTYAICTWNYFHFLRQPNSRWYISIVRLRGIQIWTPWDTFDYKICTETLNFSQKLPHCTATTKQVKEIEVTIKRTWLSKGEKTTRMHRKSTPEESRNPLRMSPLRELIQGNRTCMTVIRDCVIQSYDEIITCWKLKGNLHGKPNLLHCKYLEED